ncbi:hypothetical protein SARC_08710 [Sphaeroforma arctica JP610]|uniref:Uncharacterized protein n=1 Tax=Sphaeroforma arctica JP610 TaxID=667725 RepID=A0A0L0FPZ3_9EUKA|nr:hypothetical protein SARC_08710 [Sphaeroforma arctica JP610]KNC78872.1 hypothetical protein SARC_08710 [Sphaeroforma arctica JP610]|eukprot:XP_014152774.1 hypothetical protein SARC_08710 [Sphaeroforma arctica JP610]
MTTRAQVIKEVVQDAKEEAREHPNVLQTPLQEETPLGNGDGSDMYNTGTSGETQNVSAVSTGDDTAATAAATSSAAADSSAQTLVQERKENVADAKEEARNNPDALQTPLDPEEPINADEAAPKASESSTDAAPADAPASADQTLVQERKENVADAVEEAQKHPDALQTPLEPEVPLEAKPTADGAAEPAHTLVQERKENVADAKEEAKAHPDALQTPLEPEEPLKRKAEDDGREGAAKVAK